MGGVHGLRDVEFERHENTTLEYALLRELFPSWTKHANGMDDDMLVGRHPIAVWRTPEDRPAYMTGKSLDSFAQRLYTSIIGMQPTNNGSFQTVVKEFGPFDIATDFWNELMGRRPSLISCFDGGEYFERQIKQRYPDAVALEPHRTQFKRLCKMKATAVLTQMLKARDYDALTKIAECHSPQRSWYTQFNPRSGDNYAVLFRFKWLPDEMVARTFWPSEPESPAIYALIALDIVTRHLYEMTYGKLNIFVRPHLNRAILRSLAKSILSNATEEEVEHLLAEGRQTVAADYPEHEEYQAAYSPGVRVHNALFTTTTRTSSLEAVFALFLLGRLTGVSEMVKECPLCGEEFPVEHRAAKYCPKCQQDKAKQKQYTRATATAKAAQGDNPQAAR